MPPARGMLKLADPGESRLTFSAPAPATWRVETIVTPGEAAARCVDISNGDS
jgi:hypothetical protein